MTTEKQVYQFEIEAKNDKLRSSQRHRNGWRALHTDKNPDGTWTITWNNDPPPPPTAEEIEIVSLRQDLQNEVIELPQLIRYLKLIEI